MSANVETSGIHGKLPTHGDFITRRLPRDFVDAWDGWLQHGIAESKSELGDRWLDVYLTSPIWSFVLESGICGASAWAGVLMPSVDRVGRYFPLTVAAQVPSTRTPPEVVMGGGEWFAHARALALSSLEDEFSLEAFDTSIAELGTPAPTGDVGASGGPAQNAFAGPQLGLLQLAHDLMEQRAGRYSLWWSDGSELVAPCLLLAAHLPAPSAWRALLDGRFGEQWLVVRNAREGEVCAGASA